MKVVSNVEISGDGRREPERDEALPQLPAEGLQGEMGQDQSGSRGRGAK